MFARIKSIIVQIKTTLIDYLFGDIFLLRDSYQTIHQKIKESEQEAIIIKLGPAFYRFYIVILTPQSKEAYTKQLKSVADLPGEEARRPYHLINQLTHSNFFLSMNNFHALALRHQLQTILKLKTFHALFLNTIEDLFETLSINTQSKAQSNDDLIKHYVINLFAIVILGDPLNKNLCQVLTKLNNQAQMSFMPLLDLIYYWNHRKLKNEFDQTIEIFLREQLHKILNQYAHEVPDKNLLQQVVFNKLGPHEPLTNKKIDLLINDPDIRVSVVGLLATDNLFHAIMTSLTSLYLSDCKTQLLEEIKSNIPIDESAVMNKTKMPILHAVYLEALRYSPPMLGIMRYTEKGVRVSPMTIPPRSSIYAYFSNACATTYFPAGSFMPERFLTKEQTLNDEAHLNQGWLTPYGAGKRMCPATQLSELLIKNMLIAFSMRVSCFSRDVIEWKNQVGTSVSIYSIFKPVEKPNLGTKPRSDLRLI